MARASHARNCLYRPSARHPVEGGPFLPSARNAGDKSGEPQARSDEHPAAPKRANSPRSGTKNDPKRRHVSYEAAYNHRMDVATTEPFGDSGAGADIQPPTSSPADSAKTLTQDEELAQQKLLGRAMASEIAVDLMSMLGERLSMKNMQTLISTVTNPKLDPVVVRKHFRSVHTLKKFHTEIQKEELQSMGFTAETVSLRQKDQPLKQKAIAANPSDDIGSECRESEHDLYCVDGHGAGVSDEDAEYDEYDSDSDDENFAEVEPAMESVVYSRSVVKQLQAILELPDFEKDLTLEAKEEFTEGDGVRKERVFANAMGGDFAVKGFPAVQKYLCDYPEKFLWHTAENNPENVVSWIGGVLVYADKTEASRWHNFYPVHVSLINFTPEFQQKVINLGLTVVGYLPTKYHCVGGMKTTKEARDEILHKSMGIIYDSLAAKTLTGFACKNGRYICHPVLAVVVADFPEWKDQTGTANSLQTRKPCSSCEISRDDMHTPVRTEDFELRRCSELEDKRKKAIYLIQRANEIGRKGQGPELRRRGHSILSNNSLQPVTPFYTAWLFVDGETSCELDALRMFGFERLHNCPLGYQRIIMESAVNILDKLTGASSMRTAAGQVRARKDVKGHLISTLNRFLTETHHFSQYPGLRLDFTAVKSGLFKTDGIAGMLEAKDLTSVLTCFPFLGMILDAHLDYEGVGRFTEIFTMYTRISQTIYGRFIEDDCYFPQPDLTESQLDELGSDIERLRLILHDFLGSVPGHSLHAHKPHIFEHAVSALRRMGTFLVMSADAWEAAHKQIKEAYKASSKRSRTFITESICIANIRAGKKYIREMQEMLTLKETSEAREELSVIIDGKCASDAELLCMRTDSTVTRRMSAPFRIADLAKAAAGDSRNGIDPVHTRGPALALDPTLKSRRGPVIRKEIRSTPRAVAESLGQKLCTMLLGLIHERLFNRRYPDGLYVEPLPQQRDTRGHPMSIALEEISVCNSAAVSSHGTPDQTGLRKVIEGGNDIYSETGTSRSGEGEEEHGVVLEKLVMTMRKNAMRRLDTVVASASYYGTERFDCCLVENSGERAETVGPAGLKSKFSDGLRDAHVLHAVKLLGFFKIPCLAGDDGTEDWILVQYFDVDNTSSVQKRNATGIASQSSTQVPLHPVEDSDSVAISFDKYQDILRSVRLRWLQNSTGDVFVDLIPASSIRGKIQVVRLSGAFSEVHGRKGKELGWKDDFFYINRYLTSGQGRIFNTVEMQGQRAE